MFAFFSNTNRAKRTQVVKFKRLCFQRRREKKTMIVGVTTSVKNTVEQKKYIRQSIPDIFEQKPVRRTPLVVNFINSVALLAEFILRITSRRNVFTREGGNTYTSRGQNHLRIEQRYVEKNTRRIQLKQCLVKKKCRKFSRQIFASKRIFSKEVNVPKKFVPFLSNSNF